ncbi:hypothetical protein ZPAH1_orf00058 [Aeromonas phage ZPAH1]|nr:hypothetical protein ASwh1_12 [Aeromonas phage Aswh_1]QQG33820.1 hypothetical protein ZPAH1_orf00058 [Aeromonas phage ZPAH1]
MEYQFIKDVMSDLYFEKKVRIESISEVINSLSIVIPDDVRSHYEQEINTLTSECDKITQVVAAIEVYLEK